jgi:hypothetical protein
MIRMTREREAILEIRARIDTSDTSAGTIQPSKLKQRLGNTGSIHLGAAEKKIVVYELCNRLAIVEDIPASNLAHLLCTFLTEHLNCSFTYETVSLFPVCVSESLNSHLTDYSRSPRATA